MAPQPQQSHPAAAKKFHHLALEVAMRKLVLTLVPLLFLACDREPVAPDSEVTPSFSVTSEWQEFTLVQDLVVYNQCVGENLHISGTVIIRLHVVTAPGDTRLLVLMEPVVYQLEGLTTGQIWTPVPGDHNREVLTASGDFHVAHVHFVFSNQTTGAVLDWPIRVTFVTNARGEIKVDRFQFLDACKLRH